MALGASRWNVQFDVIWKTLRLVLLGMVVGMSVSLAASRLIAALLFGTAASDPKTFFAVALLLLAVALLAEYLPAWRASRINPMIALRNN
jgi:ABC-type antimicrobial peptide transport system permease subunit